jgi:hypothetical protein
MQEVEAASKRTWQLSDASLLVTPNCRGGGSGDDAGQSAHEGLHATLKNARPSDAKKVRRGKEKEEKKHYIYQEGHVNATPMLAHEGFSKNTQTIQYL